MDRKEIIPADPEPIFVSNDFITGFEKLIEKLEASRNEFIKIAEEMQFNQHFINH